MLSNACKSNFQKSVIGTQLAHIGEVDSQDTQLTSEANSSDSDSDRELEDLISDMKVCSNNLSAEPKK